MQEVVKLNEICLELQLELLHPFDAAAANFNCVTFSMQFGLAKTFSLFSILAAFNDIPPWMISVIVLAVIAMVTIIALCLYYWFKFVQRKNQPDEPDRGPATKLSLLGQHYQSKESLKHHQGFQDQVLIDSEIISDNDQKVFKHFLSFVVQLDM